MNSKKLKLKKEIVLQILIVGIWIWVLIKEWVLYKVLINFLLITIVILVYSRILNYVDREVKSVASVLKITNPKKEVQIYKILIFVYKYKNPLLIWIFKIEAKIFDWMRYINWKCLKYKKMRFYIKLILKNVLTNPWIILHYKYYETVIRWRKLTLKTLVLKRMLSFIINVLFLASVISLVKSVLLWKWIIWIGYVVLVILGIMSEMGERRFFFKNIETSGYFLMKSRENASLLGILLLRETRALSTEAMKLVNLKKSYSLFTSVWISKNPQEEGLYKVWEDNKSHLLYTYMLKEIPKRPSISFYDELRSILEELVLNILEYEYIYEYLKNNTKEVKNKEDVRKAKYVYEHDKLRIKVILFLMWDIENYLGVRIKTQLKTKVWGYMDTTLTIEVLQTEETTDPLEIEKFQTADAILAKLTGPKWWVAPGIEEDDEEKKYFYKEDEIRTEFPIEEKREERFFDIEENYEYYDKLYKLTSVKTSLYTGSLPNLLLYSKYQEHIEDAYAIDIIGDNEIKSELEKINKGLQEEISQEWNTLKGVSLKERNLKMLEKLESYIEKELSVVKNEKNK